MNKLIRFVLTFRGTLIVCGCVAILLTACGSGGGGDAGPVTQASQQSNVDSSTAGDDAPGNGEAFGDLHKEQGKEQESPGAPDELPTGDVPDGEFAIVGYPAQEDGEGFDAIARRPGGDYAVYVSPKGSDANPGTLARPFRSLARAARVARKGTTVFVAPGSYEGGFQTLASGTAAARIYYFSTNRWGAKIVPPINSTNSTAWDNRGSYVDIIGFDVDGSARRNGTPWSHGIYSGGSYVAIRKNRVHHIAQTISCTRGGGSAIGIDSYYYGIQSDVIGNLVHDIGPAGCTYVQGIYVSTSGSVKNNVVYRVSEAGIHLWHDANNVIITNNTVTASNTGIIVGGGNFYHTPGPNDYTSVYSNIVYDNKIGISEQGRTGLHNTYRNNLVYQNTLYNWSLKNGLTHSATVSAAPVFASGAPNLKLSHNSPAIGRATSSYADSTDFDGRARNASTGYDIGAYQH